MRKLFIFSRIHKQGAKPSVEYVMYEQFKYYGVNAIILDRDYVTMFDKNGQFLIYSSPAKQFYPVEQNDVVIIRRPGMSSNSRQVTSYLHHLKDELNLIFYNPYEINKFTNDKYMNYMFLKQNNIPTPKTVYIPRVNISTTDTRLLSIADQVKYPLVIKSLTGSLGNDVLKIHTDDQLKSIAEILYRKTGPFIMQENINANYDIRVFTLGNKILGSMIRNRVGVDFRTNFSKGATVELYTLTELEQLYVETILQTLRDKFGDTLLALGIDFIKDSEGNPYCLEINGSPGMKGINEVLNVDVIGSVTKYVIDKEKLLENVNY